MHRCYVYAGHSGNKDSHRQCTRMEMYSITSYVYTLLLTKHMPFKGANQNSVVIQDNCSVHHINGVYQALSDCGVITNVVLVWLQKSNFSFSFFLTKNRQF